MQQTTYLYSETMGNTKTNCKRMEWVRYGFVYLEVDWEKGTQDEQSFFHQNVPKTCKLEVHCYRLNVEGINLWNHLHRFVPSSHQTQILSKRLLDHQAPSPSSQQ